MWKVMWRNNKGKGILGLQETQINFIGLAFPRSFGPLKAQTMVHRIPWSITYHCAKSNCLEKAIEDFLSFKCHLQVNFFSIPVNSDLEESEPSTTNIFWISDDYTVLISRSLNPRVPDLLEVHEDLLRHHLVPLRRHLGTLAHQPEHDLRTSGPSSQRLNLKPILHCRE